MDSFPPLIFVVALISGVAFAIREGKKRHRNMVAAWTAAARQLGLSTKQRPLQIPSLHGTIGDVEITVAHYSSDNSRYVAFKGTYPDLGVGLKITKDNTFKKFFGQFVGSDDIDIDDSVVDEQLRIDGRDETATKAFMTSQKMAVIGDAVARYPNMKITDTTISFRVAGTLKETNAIVERVNVLTATAAALRGSAIHRSMLSDTPIHDSTVTMSPIHSGEHEEPVKEVDAVVRPHPDDAPQVPPAVVTPAPPPGPIRDKTAQPPTEPLPPTSNIDAQAVAEESFLGSRATSRTEEAFEARYTGQRIRWQGTVRSMRPYTADHHFGETPGVKIVATIAEVIHDLYGKTKIDIVAALPLGTPLIDRGDPVTISGTLDELDVPKRAIYLKNARLG